MAVTNGRWFDAVVFLLGLILGGGGAAAIGSAQYNSLEEKLEEEIDKLETRIDADYDVIMDMSRTLVRIETKVDALRGE